MGHFATAVEMASDVLPATLHPASGWRVADVLNDALGLIRQFAAVSPLIKFLITQHLIPSD
jgi:hypothetical protein